MNILAILKRDVVMSRKTDLREIISKIEYINSAIVCLTEPEERGLREGLLRRVKELEQWISTQDCAIGAVNET